MFKELFISLSVVEVSQAELTESRWGDDLRTQSRLSAQEAEEEEEELHIRVFYIKDTQWKI